LTREPIYVARPIVPDEKTFAELASAVFRSRRLANNGPMVNMLALRLAEMLQVPNVLLVANGTLAIEIAARALNFSGTVITTPFTFPATLTALLWMNVELILVDIEEDYLTIDPNSIESAIRDDHTGILGVHVYGNACDIEHIRRIGEKYSLPVLYDGAHVFDGVLDGDPIVRAGDATTLSFHATKIFNTAEGGAIVTRRDDVARRVGLLRNFGIESEDRIVEIGINAKMSEIHAALGLANLDAFRTERNQRTAIADIYLNAFERQPKIKPIPQRPSTINPLQYFAVRIKGNESGLRDRVYAKLRTSGIFARRYFYPLLSEVPAIRARLRQNDLNFPRAAEAAQEVLVLPMHGGMDVADAQLISKLVIEEANA
jgi:dTDP-4-amino-4,6-dideoxygalactose transaminase